MTKYGFERLKLMIILFLSCFIIFFSLEYFYKISQLQKYSDTKGEKAMISAVLIATTLDIDTFKRHSELAEIDGEYLEIYHRFKFYQELLGAEYVYTMVPFRDTVYRYIYDSSQADVLIAEDNLDDVSLWQPPSALDAMTKGLPVHNKIYQNAKYGEMLAGHAPILDGSSVVGTVGVDFSGSSIRQDINNEWNAFKWHFLSIMLISVIIGHLTIGNVNKNYFKKLDKQYDGDIFVRQRIRNFFKKRW